MFAACGLDPLRGWWLRPWQVLPLFMHGLHGSLLLLLWQHLSRVPEALSDHLLLPDSGSSRSRTGLKLCASRSEELLPHMSTLWAEVRRIPPEEREA